MNNASAPRFAVLSTAVLDVAPRCQRRLRTRVHHVSGQNNKAGNDAVAAGHDGDVGGYDADVGLHSPESRSFRRLTLQSKRLLDQDGAFHRRGVARINLQVIRHVVVDAVELPSRQADQPVATPTLARFKNRERREHPDQEDLESRKQFGVLGFPASEQHVVDDQIVPLRGHRRDCVPHAAEGAIRHRPRRDDDRRLSVLPDGGKGKPVGVILVSFWNHLEECVHLDVQEGIGCYRLQCFGDRAFARAADPIEKNDPSNPAHATASVPSNHVSPDSTPAPEICMAASLRLALRAMAHNNAWANHRLLSAGAELTQAELEAPRTGFFPSIQATLNHILVIDRFYVDALEGGSLGPAAWANPIPCPTLAELHTEQAAIDRRLIAWCNSMGESGPDQVIHVHRGTRVQHERADRLLLHLFQHQIHHRGQAHAMLSGTSVRPPQLDEFFSIAEAPLRTAEFRVLGWTEPEVWED